MSARQLAVASFTGLLAPAAAVAGLDWRGAVLAVPVVLLAAWCWRRLGDWTSGWRGLGWKLPTLIYIVWLLLFAGTVLAASAERVTAPEGRGVEWVALLVALPALWLAVVKPAVFGRAAEIFYLAVGAALVFVLVFGGMQVKLGRLLEDTEGFWMGFAAAAGVGCCGIVGVLLWDDRGEREKTKWGRWSGALTVALALMSGVTTGVLSPALASEQERPFFVMTVGLGQTARVEGLVSASWLLADVTLLGLLLQCGKKLWRVLGLKWERGVPWVLAAAVVGIALWFLRAGRSGAWLRGVVPVLGLLLGGVFPLMGLLCAKWRKRKKGSTHLGGTEE